ncbi:MAG: DNA primase [Spirochaetaceae bacterium]|nr:DNA primase [Spirochaetaceae bacterium]
MGRITSETLSELQSRIDAVAVVGDYVKLEKKSGRWWGRCPFHSEKTPSFTVDPDRKTYYCFGCHEGGGIINFVMEMDKLAFPEAVEFLAKRFGVPVAREDSGGVYSGESGELEKKKNDLAGLYGRVAGSFSYILTETDEGASALRYVKERGISDGTIGRFRLGYAPADPFWLHGFLLGKGYSAPFLAESGLFTKPNPRRAFFSGRLIFPIADRQGRVVAFGGRILGGDGRDGSPKYLNSSESLIYKKRETLFALDLAMNEVRNTKEVIIAEGYMDVIALHEAGVSNAAAPLGTAFTVEQARLLGRWADRIRLLFDSDTAGRTAAAKAILTCRAASVPAVVIQGEGGTAGLKDPADILKERGAGYLQQFVKNSILDFEYLLAENRRLPDDTDSAGKVKAVVALFPFLDLIDSEVEREACFRRMSDVFAVSSQSILNDYKVWREGGYSAQENIEASSRRSISMNDELYLMTAAAVNCGVNPHLFARLRSAIPIEEFEDSYAKELYVTLEECVRAGNMNFEALVNGIETGELKHFVAEKAATREFSERPESIVSDSIRRVKAERLIRKRNEIVLQMRSAKTSGLSVEDLIHEKMFIDSELAELQNLKGVNK